MKRNIFIILLLISIPLIVNSQNTSFTEKDIIGRWIEIERIEGNSTTKITENNDTYIFRENFVFHKGESTEGLILFNIAGKFSVEGNIVTIIYKDYLNKTSKNEKAKTIKYEILSFDNNRKEIVVNIRDYDYEYQMRLKRQ